VFTFVFLIFFIVFVYTAQEWRLQARLYPWAIGIPMLVLAIVQLILDLKGVERKPQADATPMDFQFQKTVDPALARRRTYNIFGWLFGFFIAIYLLGFSITIPLMVFAYLKVQSNEAWPDLNHLDCSGLAVFSLPFRQITDLAFSRRLDLHMDKRLEIISMQEPLVTIAGFYVSLPGSV
jgi:hypothetical protein